MKERRNDAWEGNEKESTGGKAPFLDLWVSGHLSVPVQKGNTIPIKIIRVFFIFLFLNPKYSNFMIAKKKYHKTQLNKMSSKGEENSYFFFSGANPLTCILVVVKLPIRSVTPR